ncbi:MAG: GDP-L-fucose synthase [Verrucomicrobiota bacterium]
MVRRILITGGTGFLGGHVTEAFQEQTDAEIISLGRNDFDLLQAGEAERMLGQHQPDAVIHLAARVGGITANRDFPADFFDDNILINTQTLKACLKAGVQKVLTFMGGCSYPGHAPSPISETEMWNGYPQPESAAYSIAKKMLLVQARAYREQHGFNTVVLIPGNVYGEYDNFRDGHSHVIPALIRRFLEAEGPTVACFGSGRPTRDFVYARDVARLIPWFLEHYDEPEPVNISSGTRTSIADLAETVREVTGYGGRIEWDTSKPDGQLDKIFDVTRLKSLGHSCDTPLREGLEKTVDWFKTAATTGDVRL